MDTTLNATNATTATPTVSSGAYNFQSTDNGARVFIQGGTNWNPGWYPITSVASNAATLNASIGASDVYLNSGSQIYPSLTNGCATTASPTNGTWTIDYSRQVNAQIAYTDLVIGATNTTFTSVANPVGKNIVGNLINITSGTGFTVQRVEVVSTATITATASQGLGTAASTGGNGFLGGALATPGQASALMTVSGMRTWVKYSSTAYSMTNANSNVSGGTVNLQVSVACSMEGYDQTRGDRTGNQPQYSWASVSAPGSVTYIFATAGAATQRFANLVANGNSKTNVGGFSATSQRVLIVQCSALNCNGTGGIGFYGVLGVISFKSCTANMCTTGITGSADSCYATACTIGFSTELCVNCLSYLNSTGFTLTGNGMFERCTADSSGTAGSPGTGTGFSVSAESAHLVDCVASNQSGSGGIGISCGATINYGTLQNCAVYNNTTHVSGTPLVNEGFIVLTAQPYVSAGTDFRPNTTAGGGAALINAGIGVAGQTDYVDVGAVQDTPSAGGNTYIFQVES